MATVSQLVKSRHVCSRETKHLKSRNRSVEDKGHAPFLLVSPITGEQKEGEQKEREEEETARYAGTRFWLAFEPAFTSISGLMTTHTCAEVATHSPCPGASLSYSPIVHRGRSKKHRENTFPCSVRDSVR